MSNPVNRKISHAPNPAWNAAIAEAERQLVLAKRRVTGLEKAVRNWKKLRDEGMPWPGSEDAFKDMSNK